MEPNENENENENEIKNTNNYHNLSIDSSPLFMFIFKFLGDGNEQGKNNFIISSSNVLMRHYQKLSKPTIEKIFLQVVSWDDVPFELKKLKCLCDEVYSVHVVPKIESSSLILVTNHKEESLNFKECLLQAYTRKNIDAPSIKLYVDPNFLVFFGNLYTRRIRFDIMGTNFEF